MTILYLIAIPILILIIWMIIRRKWKALFWTIGSLLVLAIAGWYLLLQVVSEAFGPVCDDNRKWKIGEYEIIEKNGL
jgi:4-amino-4-deoxy-L-arabinose transferase-like glycosyltransferase